ncbi:hypothetical protein GCM10009555_093770 [Acrocarpospora macrocephala]
MRVLPEPYPHRVEKVHPDLLIIGRRTVEDPREIRLRLFAHVATLRSRTDISSPHPAGPQPVGTTWNASANDPSGRPAWIALFARNVFTIFSRSGM